MTASKRPVFQRRAGAARQRGAVAGEHRERRDGGEQVGGVVAAHTRDRPAEAERGLGGADARQGGREHPADERAIDQPEVAQVVEHPQLIAGQLHVDVQLDAGECLAREVFERPLEAERRARAHVLEVVGHEQPAAAVGAL